MEQLRAAFPGAAERARDRGGVSGDFRETRLTETTADTVRLVVGPDPSRRALGIVMPGGGVWEVSVLPKWDPGLGGLGAASSENTFWFFSDQHGQLAQCQWNGLSRGTAEVLVVYEVW